MTSGKYLVLGSTWGKFSIGLLGAEVEENPDGTIDYNLLEQERLLEIERRILALEEKTATGRRV